LDRGRVERVGGGADQDHAGLPDRVRGPDDRAEVAGIADLVQVEEHRAPVRRELVERGYAGAHDRSPAGGPVPVGDPVEQVGGQPRHPYPAGALLFHHPGGRLRTEQVRSHHQGLDLCPGLHRLPDRLDPPHHERAFPAAVPAIGEQADPLHERVARAADQVGHGYVLRLPTTLRGAAAGAPGWPSGASLAGARGVRLPQWRQDVRGGGRPVRPTPAAGQPRRIGPFLIMRRLGAGGMGVVYLGRHESSAALAAVKVLHPEAADPVLLARLRRELAAARSVPRFCTAPVVAADLTGDPPYVATEYIEGPTLAEAVARRGTLAGADLEGLALGVAMALRAIHDHGVVHRDLKPSNILLSHLGPRVIDFGIARGPAVPGDTQLTLAGQAVGTVPYMAPEQVLGEEVTAAADVFAWAGVLTYAATGRPPFGSDDTTPQRILSEEPVVSGIDEPLWGLVLA